MEATDLAIEYHSDTPEFTETLKAKVADRLLKLTKRRREVTGASVAIHTDSGNTLPHEYRARIVLYQRPSSVAVTQKSDTVSGALAEALDTLERQIREQRDRRRASRRRAS